MPRPFSRPCGTCSILFRPPAVETAGYFHLRLWRGKNLRESAKSADAFRVQPAVLAHGAAGPWLKNFS
jgi:hypothetical protein